MAAVLGSVCKGSATLLSESQPVSRCACPITPDPAMAQVEKKAGLLRRSSASKKPLKEKVVLMYDEIFAVRFLWFLQSTGALIQF